MPIFLVPIVISLIIWILPKMGLKGKLIISIILLIAAGFIYYWTSYKGDYDYPAPTPIPTPTQAPTPVPTSPAPMPTRAPDDESRIEIPHRGAWFWGDQYRNEYLGIEFNMPHSWTASTDAQLAAMIGIRIGSMGNAGSAITDYTWSEMQGRFFHDMVALSSSDRSFVTFVFTRLDEYVEAHISENDFLISLSVGMSENEEHVSFSFSSDTTEIGSLNWHYISQVLRDGTTRYFFANRHERYMRLIIIVIDNDGSENLGSILDMFDETLISEMNRFGS